MSRRLVAAAVLAAVALAVPTAASADGLVTASACPPGDKGVIVGTLGRELVICTNI